MGLDMYLNAERYISKYFDAEDEGRAQKIQEMFPELKNAQVTRVRAEVGYWRKANAIHKWFVDNVQDGNDDCGDYYVPREKLKELLELVEQVLNQKDNASMALPPAAGFFFGSTEIDDYYFEDLKHTANVLKEALAMDDKLTFYYHSSW